MLTMYNYENCDFDFIRFLILVRKRETKQLLVMWWFSTTCAPSRPLHLLLVATKSRSSLYCYVAWYLGWNKVGELGRWWTSFRIALLWSATTQVSHLCTNCSLTLDRTPFICQERMGYIIFSFILPVYY